MRPWVSFMHKLNHGACYGIVISGVVKYKVKRVIVFGPIVVFTYWPSVLHAALSFDFEKHGSWGKKTTTPNNF